MPTPQDAFIARSIQSGNVAVDFMLDMLGGTRRPFELRIDDEGIEVTGKAGLGAAWGDIADVYILTMARSRYLVYDLTPEIAAAHGHGNTPHPGRWHSAALLRAPQPAVNLMYLDRDEREVLAAVEHFSGGRFRSADRVWNGPRSKDVLRRDQFPTGRQRPGRGPSDGTAPDL